MSQCPFGNPACDDANCGNESGERIFQLWGLSNTPEDLKNVTEELRVNREKLRLVVEGGYENTKMGKMFQLGVQRLERCRDYMLAL